MIPVDPGVSVALKKFAASTLSKTVLLRIGQVLSEFQQRKGERAVNALVAALCELRGLPPGEAELRLDEIVTSAGEGLRDPHEALYETFRMFAFTRTEAAWPYIARMTAEYMEESRAIDSFFRRAGWLLERCEDPACQCE
jgi:hypothetical protein